MEPLLERLNSSAPGQMLDRYSSVTAQFEAVYDPDFMDVVYALDIEYNEEPAVVHQRLLEVGKEHYVGLGMLPPPSFSKSVLAGMFSAPWTTDAYMEYVLDVFD